MYYLVQAKKHAISKALELEASVIQQTGQASSVELKFSQDYDAQLYSSRGRLITHEDMILAKERLTKLLKLSSKVWAESNLSLKYALQEMISLNARCPWLTSDTLSKAKSHCDKEGFSRLQVLTMAGDTPVLALYLKMRFRKTSFEKDADWWLAFANYLDKCAYCYLAFSYDTPNSVNAECSKFNEMDFLPYIAQFNKLVNQATLKKTTAWITLASNVVPYLEQSNDRTIVKPTERYGITRHIQEVHSAMKYALQGVNMCTN
jgi:hypothetical protein